MAITILEPNLTFTKGMSNRSSTTRIILHHAEWSSCTVYDVHQCHLNNGWSGIGYHFFVRKNGEVWRGRPENKIGAHALNNNYNSIGICCEGAYMTETMPDAQKSACKELVAYIKDKYGISTVQAHRDVCATNCPGTNYPFNEIVGASGSSNVTTSTATSTTTSSSSGALSVDGLWGQNTTTALQKALGTTVDGIVSNQSQSDFNKCNNGGLLTSTFHFGSGGSPMMKALQTKVGSTADGYVGVNTIKALQTYLGTTVDGVVDSSSPMVKQLQTRLNNGNF